MLGYQRKNVVGNLRKFGLDPILNGVCAVARNFRYSQKFENEILAQDEAKEIVLT
jgi:hypothetical protein